MHLALCLCAEIEPLDLRTKVIVVTHHRELIKPTNTGRLVPLTLRGGEVRARGALGMVLDTSGIVDPARRSLLLYPSPDSRLLTREDARGLPLTLVVTDGTWRQARKATRREPMLAGLPRVHLPVGEPSSYRLRRHSDPRFLATFEAVARALGILEGPEVQARLERVFRLMVERTLWTRGELAAEDVTGGLG
jgi:DTW domain-containing protein YfiP